MSDPAEMTQCVRCGMLTAGVKEFHPYAACLMFKACGNGKTVRANLLPVITYGMRAHSVGAFAYTLPPRDDSVLSELAWCLNRLGVISDEQLNGRYAELETEAAREERSKALDKFYDICTELGVPVTQKQARQIESHLKKKERQS